MIRRSRRTNKGQHSQRNTDEVYYISDEEEHQAKKVKSDDEYSDADRRDEDLERIEIDSDDVDEDDENDYLEPRVETRTRNRKKVKLVKPQQSTTNTVISANNGQFKELKVPQRISVAKFFFKTLNTQIPNDDKAEHDKLSYQWTLELERAVWTNYRQNYTEKARAIPGLLKKPEVLQKLLSKEFTCEKIVSLKPEDAIKGLDDIAEKVKSESMRRSVLKAEEGQRIRRTHKGEEIVEDVSGEHNSEIQVDIVSRSVDHRRFDDNNKLDIAFETPPSKIDSEQKVINYNYQQNVYESDPEIIGSDEEEQEETVLANASLDNVESLDDDNDMDKILGTKPTVPMKSALKKSALKKPQLPPCKSSTVWKGTLTFPDFVSFEASIDFISASRYRGVLDTVDDIAIHNKLIDISEEIFTNKAYEVQGKLDRAKAEPYLHQVMNSRDFFIFEITSVSEDWKKLYDYLKRNNKVGVLNGKPLFAKDSYLITLDGKTVPSYLRGMVNLQGKRGLFALYVLQKNYEPKKAVHPVVKNLVNAPAHLPSKPGANKSQELSSILSHLGSF